MILYHDKSIFIPENINTSNNQKIFLIIRGQEVLEDGISGQVALLAEDDLKWSSLELLSEHFLGYLDDKALYAAELSQSSNLLDNTKMSTMYALLGRVADSLFTALSRAVQIVEWYRSNQYCGKCSKSLQEDEKERAMKCSCGNLVYPRISPCVIVLVTKGEELLLAHNKNFPGNFFSTLAGFIEPGESAEHSLRREVLEEVNIEIENIIYYGSQSWPFPSQLMLGFHAEFKSGDIKPDGLEIDKADWFNYQNLPEVPTGNISISGQLIESYIKSLG
ncbi:MAG: NAD(+) diphosphatase [SAR86 cluster bacterium]|jgi:NAD+ diphosphatase|nr:NAD(+) diphosphatase [SAR86 cluster bacterium]